MSLHRKKAINQVLEWARGIAESRNYVVLDTETTGLNTMDSGVCEIALVDRRQDALLNTLVNPEMKIPADAQRIHNISDEMVKGCPTLADLYPQIAALIEGKDLLVYNLAYDMPLIESALSRAGVAKLYGRTYFKPASRHCVMLQYAQYYGEPWWEGGYKNKSLKSACYGFNINTDHAHRALGDCRMTQAVVHALACKPLLDV